MDSTNADWAPAIYGLLCFHPLLPIKDALKQILQDILAACREILCVTLLGENNKTR